MFYKRSIYLINPKFQLKISLFISSLVFILSLVYPLTIYGLFRHLVYQTSLQNPESITSFDENKLKLILILTLYQLSFIFIVFLVCIFQGHKIAGPMFKLKRHFREIKEGAPIKSIYFRKGDHFQEIADIINQTFDSIKNDHNKDFASISEITSYIKNLSIIVPDDKKAVLQEIINKLNEIQNRYHPL